MWDYLYNSVSYLYGPAKSTPPEEPPKKIIQIANPGQLIITQTQLLSVKLRPIPPKEEKNFQPTEGVLGELGRMFKDGKPVLRNTLSPTTSINEISVPTASEISC